MKRFALLLALALALPAHAQQPSRATSTITVAPYGQAVLSANGATTWAIYQASPIKGYTAGNDLVFSAPPGNYLVAGTNPSGTTYVLVSFSATPGGGAPTPEPAPAPTTNPPPVLPVPPTPAPPQPATDGGLPFYPTILPPTSGPTSSFAASVARAAIGKGDPKAWSLLYSMVATEIELDGRLASPKLKTFKDAGEILKKEKSSFLGEAKLSTQISSLASAEFARTGIKIDSQLSSAVRENYVVYLRQLASGFEQAANAQ